MRATLIAGIVLVTVSGGLGAQDRLSVAKDLYASAAYEDALSTLSSIDSGSIAPDMKRQIDEYRAFCLYALGRTREAESIAESMIRSEPLARLDVDASPRLEGMFTDVRRRLLPSIIRERFRTAKSALDRKSFSAAEATLTEARLMIAEAEKLGLNDDGLQDLNILVDGFLQLIRSAAEPSPSPPVPAAASVVDTDATVTPQPSAPPPAPVAAPPISTSSAPASPSGSASASRPPAPGSGPRVYSIDDEGVSPPVALEQSIPLMTPKMQLLIKATLTSAILDVVIDETGRVADATLRQSVSSIFDTLILRTVRRWKYQPAMKDGIPVRFVKTFVLVP